MTVKIYVARDSEGREWPPNKSHEVKACEWMLQKAWLEFHHLQEFFAFIVNVEEPSADMVVIREIGMGILELKNHYGDIAVDRDGIWRAGRAAVHAGIHLNPREQVRIYATKIRGKVIRDVLPPRMQMNKKHWNDHKFQTGVCFTNPQARLEKIQKYFDGRPPEQEDWEEKFTVFDIDSFTQWVRDLRFELEKDPPRDFSLFRLNPDAIESIATRNLNAVEWQEMMAAMPAGKPYGYLILEDATGREVFKLTRNITVVGRSHECEVVLPSRYPRVSKHHLRIERNVAGITITDLSSRNGTFMNGKRIKKTVRLEHDNTLSLGGPPTGNKSCVLSFQLQGMISDKTTITEQGTQELGEISLQQPGDNVNPNHSSG